MSEVLPAIVMDVKHWKEQSAYLITIPRYYFDGDIKYWGISPLGQYINDILIDSPEFELGIYIFDTENGDEHEKVSKIIEFMLQNAEDLCTIYTFAQCPSCKEIGTISEKFSNFNFITEEKCEHCTYLLDDVSSPVSKSKMTTEEMMNN